MSERWDDITRSIARQLIRRHGVVGLVDIPDCGALLNLALSDGRTISYWEGSDYGPEAWRLWDRPPAAL